MSAEQVSAIVDRAMTDAAFRDLLAREPEAALSGYDLTPDERAAFVSGTIRAERLEDRVSKSDLSAAFAAKTASPLLKSPSETRRKG